MSSNKWTYAMASATGNGHLVQGTPCQDACGVADNDGHMITVVADGAGSCINAQYGSRQVVDSCLYHFNEAIKEHKWTNDNLPGESQWKEVAMKCLYAARQDLEKYSVNHEMEVRSLSCTVIVVVAFDSCLLMAHIGDGRAGYCNDIQEWHPLLTPWRGELANQTVFITSDIWNKESVDEFVKTSVVTGDIKAFCLLTDGCERAAFECNLYDVVNNVYYDPNKPYPLFFNPNVKILEQLHHEGRAQDEVNALWQKFLEAGNEKLRTETDDKTMILAVRL